MSIDSVTYHHRLHFNARISQDQTGDPPVQPALVVAPVQLRRESKFGQHRSARAAGSARHRPTSAYELPW